MTGSSRQNERRSPVPDWAVAGERIDPGGVIVGVETVLPHRSVC